MTNDITYGDEILDEGENWDSDEAEDEDPFHAELRLVIERSQNTPLGDKLIPLAEQLLALPEESVAALHAAAVSMTEAASFGR